MLVLHDALWLNLAKVVRSHGFMILSCNRQESLSDSGSRIVPLDLRFRIRDRYSHMVSQSNPNSIKSSHVKKKKPSSVTRRAQGVVRIEVTVEDSFHHIAHPRRGRRSEIPISPMEYPEARIMAWISSQPLAVVKAGPTVWVSTHRWLTSNYEGRKVRHITSPIL